MTLIKHLSLVIMMLCSVICKGQNNAIYYPTHENSPLYSKTLPDPTCANIEPIIFTPVNRSTGNNNEDAETIGYFWEIRPTPNIPHKTSSDISPVVFPGKARINNDQFINVIAYDATKINTSEHQDLDPTIINNILNPGALTMIGIFRKNNIMYHLYGQFYAPVIPDPA